MAWKSRFTYTCPGTIEAGQVIVFKAADFPANMINGHADGFINGGGNALAYDSQGGTRLPIDIVRCNTATQEVEIHVRHPTGGASATVHWEADDTITSQPLASAQYGRNEVWQDYLAVYHLDEAVNNAAGGYTDSSGNADATGVSMSLPEVAGQIGFAQDFDGTADRIQIPQSAIASAISANSISVSAWVKMDSLASDGSIIGAFTAAGDRSFLLYMDADGAGPNYRFIVSDSTSGFTSTSTDSGGAIAGTWQKVKGTWDGTTARVYVDGALNSSGSGARLMGASSTDAAIGTDGADTTIRAINGKIDEAAIKVGADTSAWEVTEHGNQSATTTWGTVGPWEQAGGLTAVTKTATTRWDVLNAISKDATLIWDILTSAGQSATLRWDLLNAIQSDATIRFNVLGSLTHDVTVLWDLLNSHQLDATVRWDLLNAIQSDATLRWNVESSLASVTQSATLRWDALNATQADATLRWHVLNAVSKQSALLWDVLNAAQVNATTRWDVLEAITQEITARWQILGLSSVAKTATLRWDTLESTTGSITLRWSITDGSETPDLFEGAVRIDSITRKITIQSLTRKITIN